MHIYLPVELIHHIFRISSLKRKVEFFAGGSVSHHQRENVLWWNYVIAGEDANLKLWFYTIIKLKLSYVVSPKFLLLRNLRKAFV